MTLPQTLQPNERGVGVYTDGIFQGYEKIVTLTDEQLYQEQIESESNDAIHDIKDKLENWDTLTPVGKVNATKSLLTCMLNLYRGQY